MREGHMENIKVSVVMPVLNGMPYFEKALASVLNQTLAEMEILVVDAGSTDGTVEYVQEMQCQTKRLRLLHSDKKSTGYQGNLGVYESQGEYVAFCEADDYLEADMLETLYAAAEKQDKPDTVKGDIYMFIEKQGGGEFTLYYHILPPEARWAYGKIVSLQDIPELYMRDANMWNGIFRRDFLLEKEILQNETPGASYQDTGFVQQVNMLAKRQLFVRQAFYHYRRDNEGSSMYKKNASVYIIEEFWYMVRFLENHLEKKDVFAPLLMQRMMGLLVSFCGKDIYYNGSIECEEKLDEFTGYLGKVLKSSTDSIKFRLYGNRELNCLLRSTTGFLQSSLESYKLHKANVSRFYEYITDKKEVVIFGAGDTGQSLLAFLVTCGYEGSLVFCDNAPDVQGKNIMGLRVMAVANVCRRYPDAVYCIPSTKYYMEMQRQLMQEGVCADRIILSPLFTAHTSMEIKGLIETY